MRIPCPQCTAQNDASSRKCVHCRRSFDDVHVFGYADRAKLVRSFQILLLESFTFLTPVPLIYGIHSLNLPEWIDGQWLGLYFYLLLLALVFLAFLSRDYSQLFRRFVYSPLSVLCIGLFKTKVYPLDGAQVIHPAGARRCTRFWLVTVPGSLELDDRIHEFQVLTRLLEQWVLKTDIGVLEARNGVEMVDCERTYRPPKWIAATIILGNLLFWGAFVGMIVLMVQQQLSAWMLVVCVLWLGFCAFFTWAVFCIPGTIQVTADHISERRLLKRTVLFFSDIKSATWKTRLGETIIRLEGESGSIHLSGYLHDFMELAQLVRMRRGIDNEAGLDTLPISIGLNRMTRLANAVLPAVCYGIAFWCAWYIYHDADPLRPTRDTVGLWMVSIALLCAGVWSQWFSGVEKYVFDTDKISVYRHRSSKVYSVSDLEGFELTTDNNWSALEVRVAGKRLVLHTQRFQLVPEALYFALLRHYPPQLHAKANAKEEG